MAIQFKFFFFFFFNYQIYFIYLNFMNFTYFLMNGHKNAHFIVCVFNRLWISLILILLPFVLISFLKVPILFVVLTDIISHTNYSWTLCVST